MKRALAIAVAATVALTAAAMATAEPFDDYHYQQCLSRHQARPGFTNEYWQQRCCVDAGGTLQFSPDFGAYTGCGGATNDPKQRPESPGEAVNPGLGPT